MHDRMIYSIVILIVFAWSCEPSFAQLNFWQQSKSAVHVYSIATSRNRQVFAGVYPAGLLISIDNGKSWLQSGFPYDVAPFCAFGNAGTVFAATLSGLLYRSSDDGASWTMPDSSFLSLSAMFKAIVNTPNGYLFAGATRNISPCPCAHGVYRTTDDGMHWQLTSLTRGIGSMFASSQGQVFASSDSLFRSQDYGESWVNRSSGLATLPVNSLGATVGGSLFAGTNQGVFSSSDVGDHWTESGLASFSVKAIATYNQNIVVAGTDSGVFISHDGGTTWIQENSGLTQSEITSLAFDSSGYVYAGTPDSGICRSSQIVTGIQKLEAGFPTRFLLFQNYPNPFNPTTIIKYELPKSSMVRLSVHDILGRQVAVLVSERKSAGVYKVKFDVSRLASGVYFYRIQAGDFVQARRLVILK